MLLRFDSFGGLVPRLDGAVLPDNGAQTAKNALLSSGTLEALNNTALICALGASGQKSIYRFGLALNSDSQYWFCSASDVDFVKGPISLDTEEHTFFTGGDYPRYTRSSISTSATPYPTASYRLGIPKPANKPSVTIGGSGSTTPETRLYVYTYVTAKGWEGPPSDDSDDIDVQPGQTVTVGNFAVPSGNYEITKIRIYRMATGSQAADLQYVAEIAIATTSYVDSLLQKDLGDILATRSYEAPPDTLKGLVAMPNGILAAWDSATYDVMLSEPYLPYAWPSLNRRPLDYPIVGLGCFGTTLVACTAGVPYMGSGTDPGSITMTALRFPHACASKRSVVSITDSVIYAAPDGLVQIGSQGYGLATEDKFTRREWQRYNPATMIAVAHDSKYHVFYSGGDAGSGCLILDLYTKHLTDCELVAQGAYQDKSRDAMFITDGTSVYKWNFGLPLTYTYRTRKVEVPKPLNFGVCQVLAATYPLTVKIYADGVLSDTITVADEEPFSLSAGFKARYWELELIGTSKVRAAYLAESYLEIKNG